MAISGGSPQMKGSFLHRAVSADKAVENASPKRVRKQLYTRENDCRLARKYNFFLLFKILRSPKLGRPRNSPASTHVRRKLPLSKYDDDDDQVSLFMGGKGRGVVGGVKQVRRFLNNGIPLIWPKTVHKIWPY